MVASVLAAARSPRPIVLTLRGRPLRVRPLVRRVADDEAQALGELVARRRQVIEMIVAEKNRRLAGRPRVLKAIDWHVDLLQIATPKAQSERAPRFRST